MNNIYNEENAFSFGDMNEKNLNYSNISGLGEGNYENEDLFNEENTNDIVNKENTSENFGYSFKMAEDSSIDSVSANTLTEDINSIPETLRNSDLQPNLNDMEENSKKYPDVYSGQEIIDIGQPSVEEEQNVGENQIVEENPNENNLFEDSSTDLQKLTEYTEEKINSTDIKSLFDKVGVNVKEASDIFKKNTEMKEKLDTRFEELKKLKSEIEKTKKTQYDEINSYKEEVLNKLTEKKEEIEKRLNKLKEFQANLEKEKIEFEEYKRSEKEEIERVQKEIQEAYDNRRDELTHIEDVLRKQKDALDEERSQLSLDMIQYEADKNELANNLLKFNEIVASFTNGMEKIEKE